MLALRRPENTLRADKVEKGGLEDDILAAATIIGRCLMRAETERKMRRWREQRWLLDQVIQTRGVDWDQGRTGKILRNCGPGVAGELQEIGRRVQKFSDISREFSRAARRREDLAAEAEQAGH